MAFGSAYIPWEQPTAMNRFQPLLMFIVILRQVFRGSPDARPDEGHLHPSGGFLHGTDAILIGIGCLLGGQAVLDAL
jgi:hypothetical protein